MKINVKLAAIVLNIWLYLPANPPPYVLNVSVRMLKSKCPLFAPGPTEFRPVQADSRLPAVNHPADPSEIPPQVEEANPGDTLPRHPA